MLDIVAVRPDHARLPVIDDVDTGFHLQADGLVHGAADYPIELRLVHRLAPVLREQELDYILRAWQAT